MQGGYLRVERHRCNGSRDNSNIKQALHNIHFIVVNISSIIDASRAKGEILLKSQLLVQLPMLFVIFFP